MPEVRIDFPATEALADAAMEKGIRSALGKAEERVKEVLSRPGSGRIYRRGGVEHQASADGEPPATDIGNLIALTNADPQLIHTPEAIEGNLESKAEYSEALEVGTERMAARPYLGLLNTDYADELREAFREGAEQ